MNTTEERPFEVWQVKVMETESQTLYRAFQFKPNINIYDSEIYTDKQEAIDRCKALNTEPIAIGIVYGDFPILDY